MNRTNRAANRALILVCGLVLLAGGAAAAAIAFVPAARDLGTEWAAWLTTQTSELLAGTALGADGGSPSAVMPAVLLLFVIGVIVLVVFIARHGGGHTGTAVTESGEDPGSEGSGTTIVSSAVTEQAIQDALGARSEFVTSHVSTYLVRRTPVLKVSVTCRRGVSPRDAASIVEDVLLSLDALLGRSLPALVQVGGGFRARVSRSTRLA